MTLEINEQEYELLRDLVNEYLPDLRVQARRADEPHYKDELIAREDVVRRVMEKLEALH